MIECGGDQEEHRPLQESLKAGAGRLDLRFRRWCHVQEVHISLDFTRKWLLVSEVEFHSSECAVLEKERKLKMLTIL